MFKITIKGTYTRQNKKPMIITDTSGTAFEKVSTDIVDPFPITTKLHEYILTIQDNFTKYSSTIFRF